MSERIEWTSYKEVLLQKARANFVPFSIMFELLPLCNFQCKMCYVQMEAAEQEKIHPLLSAKQWIALAEKCKKAGVLSVTLTGGEALLHPEFTEIYEALYDMGFMVNILTNAYLISDDVLALFRRKPPRFIRASIYGASDKTYKKVCGVEDGFTTVTTNLLALKEIGVQPYATMTLIRDNVNDFNAVKDWAQGSGIPLIASKVMHMPTYSNRPNLPDVRLMPNVPVKDDAAYDALPLSERMEEIRKNPFINCRCYKTSFDVRWDGRMVGCLSINSIYEDPFEGDLLEKFRTLWTRLSALKIPKKCSQCKLIEYCCFCPGSIAGECGDPEGEAPYICAMAKWHYEEIQKYRTRKECLE